MSNTVHTHTFPNGLTLLAESMDFVRSAAVYFLIPAGCAHEAPEDAGLASALAEMLPRGAGDRDTEALMLAFDSLGIDHNEGPGLLNMFASGSTVAKNLPQALDLFADVLLRPQLPKDDLPAVQSQLLQDLQSLDDSPQEQVMLELQRRYYPSPLNADRYGTEETLKSLTVKKLRAFHQRLFRPNGTIISVAGRIDWPKLKDQVERLFGGWPVGEKHGLTIDPAHKPQSVHLTKDKQQTQITFAFPSVSVTDPLYFAAKGTVGVLSSGMSSRLFTEVREKRGLCYSVYASHEAMKDRGTIVGYSGTRPERAQETLDVMLAEFNKLRDGVQQDEIDRTKAGLKTSLIMQQESTSARAGAIARDWYYLGRVRSFDEIQHEIDSLSPRSVMDYVDAFPFRDPTIVTLGPAELKRP
ncbi:M16 family metallopeptidase [Limnoglobus roseus]|uniref:Insulinase family protein n=1 Tax=Limnoglobus roseus TaxID=2598579 RepID=A0A5C1ABW8_9BACT|nr:pitrilysin family protein [Limnoglobus roseus]QEL15673.1 insulinase family protein [Limnoglobus roseus]